MNAKPVILRSRADQDIHDAVRYYMAQQATDAAVAFVDALEEAYASLSQHPRVGGSRYAHELEIPGLRTWPLHPFPYLIFYLDRDDRIDVWRVLHGRRDIRAAMRE